MQQRVLTLFSGLLKFYEKNLNKWPRKMLQFIKLPKNKFAELLVYNIHSELIS